MPTPRCLGGRNFSSGNMPPFKSGASALEGNVLLNYPSAINIPKAGPRT